MPATALTTVIYTVQPGDTLSKLALRYYGNAQNYPTIANANDLDPAAILPIGKVIRIPGVANPSESPVAAIQQPSLPAPVQTAVHLPALPSMPVWMKDWRVLLGAGLIGVAVLYFVFGNKRRNM